MTNINSTEWGNQELPGLSDDKLLSTNWNRATAMRKRNADPEFKEFWMSTIQDRTKTKEWQKAQRKALDKRNANPVWRENVANAYKQYVNDPEWQEGQRRRAEQRKNDPEWRRRHAEAMANKSPETRKEIAEFMRNEMKKPERLAKMAKANRIRLAKPCITPFGVFATGAEAGNAYNEMRGVTNGKNAVCNHLKKGTPGYQYITREEYTRLTGREI